MNGQRTLIGYTQRRMLAPRFVVVNGQRTLIGYTHIDLLDDMEHVVNGQRTLIGYTNALDVFCTIVESGSDPLLKSVVVWLLSRVNMLTVSDGAAATTRG